MKIAALIFFALTVLLTGCGDKPSNRLVVGMELAYPPFEMTDQQGQPAGISVDLARDLGKQLGRDVEIENIPFHGLIPSLQTHKIDLIISSMTATSERSKSIAFSGSIFDNGTLPVGGEGESDPICRGRG